MYLGLSVTVITAKIMKYHSLLRHSSCFICYSAKGQKAMQRIRLSAVQQQAGIDRRGGGDNRRNQQTRRSLTTSRLQPPEVIFSNNHLLVVNKTPGWKSQPGDGSGSSGTDDTKCLLTYLRKQGLGGGSQNDFLTPTHRLDQPCSGVLIFAKNGKSASRVQVAWSKRQIEKFYWVVVEGGNSLNDSKLCGLELLKNRSSQLSDGSFRLSATINSKKATSGGRGSVSVKPVPPSTNSAGNAKRNNDNNKGKDTDGRLCHIEWKHLKRLPDTEYSTTRHLLSVKTDTGAKHQVRALLAIAGGAPIAGDLRYGNNVLSINQGGGRVQKPLKDKSVALHARSVFLPTVSLGSMEFLREEPFIAAVPKYWKRLFGIAEH
jgi:23S rRNA-/tRNA-specific pseudouridylate synthase